MTTEIKVSVAKKFQSNSSVNKYDLLTLEQSSEGLTEERIVLAFQAFDELIPYLGVFTRIFQKLREDLFEAVYSEELTGTTENHSYGDAEYIQRLPYFSLVRQVYKKRHELTEQLKGQLDIAETRLLDTNRQLEDAHKTIVDKENHISALNILKGQLESLVDNKDKQLNELRDELEETRATSRLTEHNLTCDIRELTDCLDEAKNEVSFLSKFKKGYDDLYNAFMDKSDTLGSEPTKDRKLVISTKRSKLLSGIESGQKLEEQILTMMNIVIEEYDNYIETHKFKPPEKVASDDPTSADQGFLELEIAEQEIENVQIKYQNSVRKLMTELALLQKHNTMLVEQLQMLKEISPAVNNVIAEREPAEKGNKCVPQDLMDIQEEVRNPFIPHERVFSKYAAMLFTSNNNGKTFEEFKETKYCSSCGEKTVICPHKISGSETIFSIPKNCSHIKLTRPEVRISKDFLSEIQKLQSPHSPSDVAALVNGHISDQPQSNYVIAPTKTSNEIPPVKDEPVYMVHTMQRLWDDYRQRTKTDRAVPRSLDLERTRSLMEQFLGYLVWTDEFVTDAKANLSILDQFYCFMRNRYLVEDVMFMTVHDFMSAIVRFSEDDKMVQLLGHVFVGNLDASCLRYVFLMLDFISSVTWKEVEDFRPFCSVVYPFLNDDDLESLQMNYTAYSENKISSRLVFSFIIHIIRKNREPRFLEFQKKLVQYQIDDVKGQLKDTEFKEALDNLLPLCSELTRRRLYLQSERAVEWDGIVGAVPITRLAQISGYLEIHLMAAIVKDIVEQRVYKWRERPRSALTGLKQESIVVPEIIRQDQLLTMEHVKQLASDLNRYVASVLPGLARGEKNSNTVTYKATEVGA